MLAGLTPHISSHLVVWYWQYSCLVQEINCRKLFQKNSVTAFQPQGHITFGLELTDILISWKELIPVLKVQNKNTCAPILRLRLSCYSGLHDIATNCKHDFSEEDCSICAIWHFYLLYERKKKKKKNESGKILSKIAGKKPSRKKKKKSTHRRLRPHGKEKERALQTVWFNILFWFLYGSKEMPCIPI